MADPFNYEERERERRQQANWNALPLVLAMVFAFALAFISFFDSPGPPGRVSSAEKASTDTR